MKTGTRVPPHGAHPTGARSQPRGGFGGPDCVDKAFYAPCLPRQSHPSPLRSTHKSPLQNRVRNTLRRDIERKDNLLKFTCSWRHADLIYKIKVETGDVRIVIRPKAGDRRPERTQPPSSDEGDTTVASWTSSQVSSGDRVPLTSTGSPPWSPGSPPVSPESAAQTTVLFVEDSFSDMTQELVDGPAGGNIFASPEGLSSSGDALW